MRVHETMILDDGWAWVTFNKPFDCFMAHPQRKVSEVVRMIEDHKRKGPGEAVPA